MIPTQQIETRRSIAFCSNPYEGLRIIRNHQKGGKPMPKALMVAGPLTDRLLKNMSAKIEKLTGRRNCPELIVVPAV